MQNKTLYDELQELSNTIKNLLGNNVDPFIVYDVKKNIIADASAAQAYRKGFAAGLKHANRPRRGSKSDFK